MLTSRYVRTPRAAGLSAATSAVLGLGGWFLRLARIRNVRFIVGHDDFSISSFLLAGKIGDGGVGFFLHDAF